jgi:hypothetical protein
MANQRKVEVNGHTYWSDGTSLGVCKQCADETAFHYDENGNALCEDCLIMNHIDGKYDDDIGSGKVYGQNSVDNLKDWTKF